MLSVMLAVMSSFLQVLLAVFTESHSYTFEKQSSDSSSRMVS